MPSIDLVVRCPISTSTRVRQLEAMFDVPRRKYSECRWKMRVPFDERPWSVGLIVGPSGSGKSTIARELFGDHVDVPLRWRGKSVIDDFDRRQSMDAIAATCKSVGFNTIPSWLRPYKVLSTGERFRVDLARRLLECKDPIVVDEFTSVVDRQVAKIGAHAVQKWVRREKRQFVAVTCHYDVVHWLQPDWILEPATGRFARRSVQPRPRLEIEICRVHRSAWKLFAPFHYLTARLHRGAKCTVIFCEGQPAGIACVIHRPHWKAKNIKGVTRGVTLPDWQGLGLAHVHTNCLGAAYKALGWRLHVYPSHPTWIRSIDRSPHWGLVRRPATFVPSGKSSTLGLNLGKWGQIRGNKSRAERSRNKTQGMRPCATFCYIGPAMEDAEQAARLLGEVPHDPTRFT